MREATPDPTPAKIEAECQVIQAAWTDAERAKWAGGWARVDWLPPE